MIDDNENDIKCDYYVNDARVTEISRSHLHKFIKQKANAELIKRESGIMVCLRQASDYKIYVLT